MYMVSPTQFIDEIRGEKESILMIIACSGSKRRDYECEKIVQKFQVHRDTQSPLSESHNTLNRLFRQCVEKYHPTAVDKDSKPYPAFIRYSGYFYRAVEETYGLELWKEALNQGWNILILSAYYGFLQIDDPIQYYNLRIPQLNKQCLEILPRILNAYLETKFKIEKIVFFTSETYMKPFRFEVDKPIYRLSLKDKFGREIGGPYGKDYYSLAGKTFANIIAEEKPHLIDKTISIELEG